MLGAFLLYLLKWVIGLAAGAFVLKLATIGGGMLLERSPRH